MSTAVLETGWRRFRRPSHPERTVVYRLFEEHFERYVRKYEERYEAKDAPPDA